MLGLIDLGLVGRLSPKLRDRLIDLVIAIGREDYAAHRRRAATRSAGRRGKVDRGAFRAEVARLADKYLRRKRSSEIADRGAHPRPRAAARSSSASRCRPRFMMVGKTLMTVEGIGRQIYPGARTWSPRCRPYLVEILGARYSPERITERPDAARDALRCDGGRPAQRGRRDPGRPPPGAPHASRFGSPRSEQSAERLGRRVFTGIVIGALIVAAAMLLGAGQAVVGWAMLAVAAGWGSCIPCRWR